MVISNKVQCKTANIHSPALITISTRASLKRYHTFTLTLGLGDNGDEWDIQRIGTESEKLSVEKELAELRERLAKVEEWTSRRDEIDEELKRVWVGEGETLEPPAYELEEGEANESNGDGVEREEGIEESISEEAESGSETAE
jgi:ATP-binding cassette subfamily D (ALD) long-chain fatty acid import protein